MRSLSRKKESPSAPLHAGGVVVGRYTFFEAIASGGMASVHLGRLMGPVGFTRTVAIKRLHEQFASDPEFVTMFLDEARLAARVRHPNVVPTLDVVAEAGELLLVMEYVSGLSLAQLLKASEVAGVPPPVPVVVDIMVNVLNGLHAAHEATNERGEPLHIVHRDVSPHNILVGTDGISRVLDFGVAKAAGQSHQTQTGLIRGKLRYMAPEQIRVQRVDRRTDVYAAGMVFWEALTGRRPVDGQNDAQVLCQLLEWTPPPPSELRDIPRDLDAIVLRALRKDPAERFETARAMAAALEVATAPVARSAVASWVIERAGDEITRRQGRVAAVENESVLDLQEAESRSACLSEMRVGSRQTLELVSAQWSIGPVGKRRTVLVVVAAALAVALIASLSWQLLRRAPTAPATRDPLPAQATVHESLSSSARPPAAPVQGPALEPAASALAAPVQGPALEPAASALAASGPAKRTSRSLPAAIVVHHKLRRAPAPAKAVTSTAKGTTVTDRLYRRD